MVINDNMLSMQVLGNIANTSHYSAMDFLDEYQFLDMHSYTYTDYEMYLDFVNVLMIGIEKTTKAHQE